MDHVLPTPGSYVVAVSGGVDSMVLLHVLQQQPGLKLTVAHFDHGIRQDSGEDRRLVQETAASYGLPFVYDEGLLGPNTSEAVARQARQAFLSNVYHATGARAVLTAHHQDDAIETAILNILRGTGRKGVSALRNHHNVQRPLLAVPKIDIITHATDHGLVWREDSTNQDEAYLRNYVRRRIVPRLTPEARSQLLELMGKLHNLNYEIDRLLTNELHLQPVAGQLVRSWFAQLPHPVAKEVMASWLRANGLHNFDSAKLERLVIAGKVAEHGKQAVAGLGRSIYIGKNHLALQGVER